MNAREKNEIIRQLRSIKTSENEEIIINAIECIRELDSERRTLLSAVEGRN